MLSSGVGDEERRRWRGQALHPVYLHGKGFQQPGRCREATASAVGDEERRQWRGQAVSFHNLFI